MVEPPDPDVELVAGDPAAFVPSLRTEEGGDIWICGGSRLASSLFDAGLVDRIIVKLNPIVFGEGIPLLAESVRSPALRLAGQTVFDSGHVLLDYEVPGAAAD